MSFYTLILLGSLGLWLGMPNPLHQIPILALLYPLCLFRLGQHSPTYGTALRRGWLSGLLGGSAVVYWIAVPVHDFGGIPWLLAAPCALAMGAYLGFYGGLFALFSRAIRQTSPVRQATLAALAWFLLEWVRSWLCTGFPWLTLSAAFAPWPFLIQGASVVGAFGLSGLLVFLVCLITAGVDNVGRERKTALLGGVTGIALLSLAGLWRLEVRPLEEGPRIPVTLIQGNVDQSIKWSSSLQQGTVRRYLDLTEGALDRHPDTRLVIWPETAMPFDFEHHTVLRSQIQNFAQQKNVALLLGSVGQRGSENPDRPKALLFNRAYLVAPIPVAESPSQENVSPESFAPHSPTQASTFLTWYEKEHLVPFGEYPPPWLNLPFLRPLLQEVGDFTQGQTTAPLSFIPAAPGQSPPGALPPVRPLVLGVLICYETLFPELARQRVADGAALFINISNDAWFGSTSAPEQHLQLTLVRSVEQGRYMARATNTGISAFIDPYGRRLKTGGLFRAETIALDVAPVTEKTLYFHLAPWLPASAALALLLLCWGVPSIRRSFAGKFF